MLFVSAFDIITEPIRTLVIILQSMLGIGCIIIGILFLLIMRKKGETIKKAYFFALPLFFVLIGISRGILVYHDFFAPDELDLQLWAIAHVVIFGGFISLNYTIETHVYNKTKHFFTILGIILTSMFIIAVFIDKSFAKNMSYITIASQVVPPLLIYLIVAYSGSGVVRKKAVVIIIGLATLIIAQSTGIFETIGIMDKIFASVFAPPTALIGLAICAYGFILSV
jgi:hypothetical protein